MKICLYFAVSKFGNFIYLEERKITNTKEDKYRLIDLIENFNELKNELNWSMLDEEHKPENIGCYQAIVECNITNKEHYNLDVISCTPMFILFN